jgi:hypothetical protein
VGVCCGCGCGVGVGVGVCCGCGCGCVLWVCVVGVKGIWKIRENIPRE